MGRKTDESSSGNSLLKSKPLLIIILVFVTLIYIASLFLKSGRQTKASTQLVTLSDWKTTAAFPGDGSPYGSFVRNGIYYVNTTFIDPSHNNDGHYKETYMGKPDGSGNITQWTKAWDGHAGTHGFASVTVQWSGSEQKVFMLRNGHIGEYVFHSDGTIGQDVTDSTGKVIGTDYKFWGNEENKTPKGITEPFDGRLFVWDSIVFAPLSTGKYVYEMGGFSCPGHGCTNTCTDAGCSSANIDYKNNGNIYYQQVPFVHWNASEKYYKFKYTGKNHPDWKETQDNIDAPGKSVFYAPNGGGADYGFIYVTHNRGTSLYKTRVNSDGSLSDFSKERDLMASTESSPQGGADRGDLFVIGDTLFVARGKTVYRASLDPSTGAVGTWDDAGVPDLPDEQVRVMGWGKDNEGSAWGVIGNYVYLTGQNAVYYAQISGANLTPTSGSGATTTPQAIPTPASCPTTSTNTYDSHQMDQNSAANTMEAAEHPDKNVFALRGYTNAPSAAKQIYDGHEPIDQKSPQISTMLDNTPSIINTYEMYDWNWTVGTKGSLLSKYDTTLIGLSANYGDSVRVPDAQFDLIQGTATSGGYTATVLYADANRLTLKYTLQDDVVSHYTIHLDNICTDPNLLSLYNQLDAQKYPNSKIRQKLPILKGKQIIATAKGEVRVAVRNSGEFIDPRLKNSWWRGVSVLPTAPPNTGGGTGATATPLPSGACSKPTAPGIISPIGGGAYPGKITIKWNKVAGAKSYRLRIDDMTNPWTDNCSALNTGDQCVDNISPSTTAFDFTGVESHTYHFWLQTVDSCGQESTYSDSGVTVPFIGDSATCRIQGYRTILGPIDASKLKFHWGYGIKTNDQNKSLTLWVPDNIKSQPVSIEGVTPSKSVQYNPYFLVVPGNTTYTVSVPELSGYNIATSFCINHINCHDPLDNSVQNGRTRTFSCPAGGYADLWFMYAPNSVPTPVASSAPVSGTPTPTTFPESSYCKAVTGANNGIDKSLKHDIVILPDGYSDEASAMSAAEKAMNAVKNTNIGSGNFAKLNFWVDTDLSKKYNVRLSCAKGIATNLPCWDFDLATKVQQICGGDSYLVIHNTKSDSSGTEWNAGGVAYVGGMQAMVLDIAMDGAPHELCHSIAGCYDEFVYTQDISGTPVPMKAPSDATPAYNCDINANCSKWTTKTGCFQGCVYDDWYRSVMCSVMRDPYSCHTFSDPATEMWTQALKNYQ